MSNATNQRTTKKRVTSASAWASNAGGHDLEVPSGNVARVRRPGMQAFIQAGLIPNALLPIVERAINGKGGVDDALNAATNDMTLEKLAELMGMYDAIALYCVIEPELHPAPATEAEREDGLLYVDAVDLDDKIFIFNWAVGGTSDLEKFRAEQAGAIQSLSAGASNAQSAERAPQS